MIEEISKIQNYAQLIFGIKEIIHDSRADKRIIVRRNWEGMQSLLVDFCNEVAAIDEFLGKSLYSSLSEAISLVDDTTGFRLVADKLEDSTLPLLYKAIALFGKIDTTEGNYRIVSTKSGFLNLSLLDSNVYFHSTIDPLWEAYEMGSRIYDSQMGTYCFLGCGLGYLPWQVYYLSDCSADIFIFHNNIKVVEYAFECGVLSWIPDNKLHIVVNKNDESLLLDFVGSTGDCDTKGYYVLEDYKASVSGSVGEIVNNFVISNNSDTIFKRNVEINKYRNRRLIKSLYHECPLVNRYDEWTVVAAGPSLDSCIDFLKDQKSRCGIICVGTVYKKWFRVGLSQIV